MRGLAMVGALVELSNAGWLWGIRRFAGTSVGAIIAAGMSIHAKPDVMWSKVLALKYTPTIDLARLDASFGLDNGACLDEWIAAVLGRDGLTFNDIREEHGSTLLVCATNLNTRRAVIFGPDSHPDMKVALALRMSCSVPFYFTAPTYEGELYVDGALTDNFPVAAAVATAGDESSARVIGVRLESTRKSSGHAWSFEQFLGAVVECSIAREAPNNTVILDIDAGSKTNPLNFSMKPAERQKLFNLGAAQAKSFIKKNE